MAAKWCWWNEFYFDEFWWRLSETPEWNAWAKHPHWVEVVIRTMVKWYFSKDRLLNRTPSRTNGVDFPTECRYRREGCRFIMDMGNKLGLYPLYVCTYSLYWHHSWLWIWVRPLLYLQDISFFSMVCFQYISVNYHISTVTGIKLYIFKGNNAHIPLILNINTMYFANNLYIQVNNHGLYYDLGRYWINLVCSWVLIAFQKLSQTKLPYQIS